MLFLLSSEPLIGFPVHSNQLLPQHGSLIFEPGSFFLVELSLSLPWRLGQALIQDTWLGQGEGMPVRC